MFCFVASRVELYSVWCCTVKFGTDRIKDANVTVLCCRLSNGNIWCNQTAAYGMVCSKLDIIRSMTYQARAQLRHSSKKVALALL